MKFFSLRRITSGGAFIPEIDGLRFIAISSVVLYHLQFLLITRFSFSDPGDWFTRRLMNNGGRGVPLFFTISGLILGLPWAKHYLKAGPAVSLKKYFLRRITRLEPPYILSMLIMFVLFSLSGHRGYTMGFWSERLLASLLYLHNTIFGVGSLLNGVAWSLEVEIQFYCLVPILTLIFAVRNRLSRRALLVGTMLCAGLSHPLWRDSPRLDISIVNYLQFFLAGFLLADVYVTDWPDTRDGHWSWDIAGLAVAPLLLYLNANWFSVAGPFLILLTCFAVFRGVCLRWLLTRPLVTIPGGMCYSIYLFHFPLMANALSFSTRLFPHGDGYLYFLSQLFAMAIVIGGFCTLFFLLIERPCMNKDWPQQLWSRMHNRKRSEYTFPSIGKESIRRQETEA
ncbi:MAG: acyltransferase [Acidobacteriaceae bacterium]